MERLCLLKIDGSAFTFQSLCKNQLLPFQRIPLKNRKFFDGKTFLENKNDFFEDPKATKILKIIENTNLSSKKISTD